MHQMNVYRDKRSLDYPDAPKIIRRAAKAVLRVLEIDTDCAIDFHLTDDEGIRQANLVHRQIDAATDVLSFPLNDLKEGQKPDCRNCEYNPETKTVLLGDTLLNLRRCETQAAEIGQSFEQELTYLTIHSVLHLLGYDHVDEGPRKKKMRAMEEKILSSMTAEIRKGESR